MPDKKGHRGGGSSGKGSAVGMAVDFIRKSIVDKSEAEGLLRRTEVLMDRVRDAMQQWKRYGDDGPIRFLQLLPTQLNSMRSDVFRVLNADAERPRWARVLRNLAPVLKKAHESIMFYMAGLGVALWRTWTLVGIIIVLIIWWYIQDSTNSQSWFVTLLSTDEIFDKIRSRMNRVEKSLQDADAAGNSLIRSDRYSVRAILQNIADVYQVSVVHTTDRETRSRALEMHTEDMKKRLNQLREQVTIATGGAGGEQYRLKRWHTEKKRLLEQETGQTYFYTDFQKSMSDLISDVRQFWTNRVGGDNAEKDTARVVEELFEAAASRPRDGKTSRKSALKSEIEEKRLRQKIFYLLDTNGDGTVSVRELVTFLQHFGPISQCVDKIRALLDKSWFIWKMTGKHVDDPFDGLGVDKDEIESGTYAVRISRIPGCLTYMCKYAEQRASKSCLEYRIYNDASRDFSEGVRREGGLWYWKQPWDDGKFALVACDSIEGVVDSINNYIGHRIRHRYELNPFSRSVDMVRLRCGCDVQEFKLSRFLDTKGESKAWLTATKLYNFFKNEGHLLRKEYSFDADPEVWRIVHRYHRFETVDLPDDGLLLIQRALDFKWGNGCYFDSDDIKGLKEIRESLFKFKNEGRRIVREMWETRLRKQLDQSALLELWFHNLELDRGKAFRDKVGEWFWAAERKIKRMTSMNDGGEHNPDADLFD